MEKEKRFTDRIIFNTTYTENQDSMTADEHEEYTKAKHDLEALRKIKIQGYMMRSKVKWLDQGEKTSKYFLNLEKRNYTSKLIPKLRLESGDYVTQTDDILKEQRRYYKELYTEKTMSTEAEIDIALSNLTAPELDPKTSESLEGPISYKELTQALKATKNGKSPGLDGFSVDFLKLFWSELGIFILRSINEAYSTGSMSISQRRAVITCIPKGNKDRTNLKNWRTIIAS